MSTKAHRKEARKREREEREEQEANKEKRKEFEATTKESIVELWSWIEYYAWGAEQTGRRTDELFQVTTYIIEGAEALDKVWQEEAEADNGSGFRALKGSAPEAVLKDLCRHLDISVDTLDSKTPWVN